MPAYLLWLVIGVEGFVALAVQMLTIRQLMPFVGNNVIVTSLIIGIFLLALAMGYWQGGRTLQGGVKRLICNFALAGTWVGIGLSYLFLAYWFLVGQQFTGANLYLLLIIYLFVITAFPVYWLGQTVPIVMNLWESKQRAGEIGGRVLQLSTIGSFLGAVFTSIILMNFLGLGWTIFVVACALLLLSLTLVFHQGKPRLISIFLAAIIAVLYWLNVLGTERFFVATNNYGQYQIFDHKNVAGVSGKMLDINNSASSFITPSGAGFPYIERIKKIVFDDMKIRDKPILVLGAGGFTFSAQGDHGNQITYVDIDPKIKAVVQQHFLKDIHGEFVGADARVFVQQTKEQYSVVIVDVYSNQLTIPPHLLTIQFFYALNQILLPNGVAIFNMVIDPFLDDPYSQAINAGLRAIFTHCVSFPEQYADEALNVIYVCQKNEAINMPALINVPHADYYTDDHNRATWDQQFLRLK